MSIPILASFWVGGTEKASVWVRMNRRVMRLQYVMVDRDGDEHFTVMIL